MNMISNRTVTLGVILALFGLTTTILVVRAVHFQDTHFRAGSVPTELVNDLIPKDIPVSSLTPPAIRLHDPLRYGAATSVVSVIEYGDYECEFCKAMHTVITDLLPQYRGSVRFVFRDLPIELKHKDAMGAAIFARCAAQQGKFWNAHDALMKSESLSERTMRRIASELAVNESALDACRKNPEIEAAIRRDIEEARADGIQSIPLIFVGTTAYDHYMTTEELRDAIQASISSL